MPLWLSHSSSLLEPPPTLTGWELLSHLLRHLTLCEAFDEHGPFHLPSSTANYAVLLPVSSRESHDYPSRTWLESSVARASSLPEVRPWRASSRPLLFLIPELAECCSQKGGRIKRGWPGWEDDISGRQETVKEKREGTWVQEEKVQRVRDAGEEGGREGSTERNARGREGFRTLKSDFFIAKICFLYYIYCLIHVEVDEETGQ